MTDFVVLSQNYSVLPTAEYNQRFQQPTFLVVGCLLLQSRNMTLRFTLLPAPPPPIPEAGLATGLPTTTTFSSSGLVQQKGQRHLTPACALPSRLCLPHLGGQQMAQAGWCASQSSP